jgi:hypothetical protein
MQSPSDWPLQIIKHSNAAFRLNPVAAMIDLMWTSLLTFPGHASHAASISETVAHLVAFSLLNCWLPSSTVVLLPTLRVWYPTLIAPKSSSDGGFSRLAEHVLRTECARQVAPICLLDGCEKPLRSPPGAFWSMTQRIRSPVWLEGA